MPEPMPRFTADPAPREPEPAPRPPTGTELAALRDDWQNLKPMRPWVRAAYEENIRLRWDTHSNAIEGNTLTYTDTLLLLVHGRTRGEHLMREYEEIQGHDAAILHMHELLAGGGPLTETDLLFLHRLMLVRPYDARSVTAKGEVIYRRIELGQYKTEPNAVRRPDGQLRPFVPPDEVPDRMERYLRQFNADLAVRPADIAILLAVQHHGFTSIHPFDDGNGRMARLLLNFTVQRHGYPALVVEEEARDRYTAALRAADSGDHTPLRDLLAERLRAALDFGIAVKRRECEPGSDNVRADPTMRPVGSIYDDRRAHTITGT